MAHEGSPLNRFAGTGWTEIPKRLVNYLNENKVQYEILHQPKDWSRQKPWRRDARYHTKVNIVRAGHQHVVAVLSTNSRIDLKWFAEVDAPVRLETEEEFKWLFPDCAVGAIPPFGNLYGLPTFVDNMLAKNDYIIFAAGTDTDQIKMSYPSYERIVQPRIGSFSVKVDGPRKECRRSKSAERGRGFK